MSLAISCFYTAVDSFNAAYYKSVRIGQKGYDQNSCRRKRPIVDELVTYSFDGI